MRALTTAHASILATGAILLWFLFLPRRRILCRLSEVLATQHEKLLMNWRFVTAHQTRDAKLPVDLCAFDPPTHQSCLPNFFKHRLQRHNADAHISFDHALDGGQPA